jgi:uncharacterized NAD(P)/FAD-binding protein YdhS
MAAEVLRRADPSTSVVLIEREGCPGRGVAYGTPYAEHLLNVRAQNMSALADDPSHFLRWARLHYDCSVQPGDYLPRRTYGQYVESILRETSEQNAGRFEWKQDEAVSIRAIDRHAEIVLRSGRTIVADKVVLALGNFPPSDPKFPGRTESNSRYVSSPWSPRALDDVEHDNSVLLVGSGLTSVDVAISLRSRGFNGKIHMLSRHGLLPRQHKPASQWPAFWDGTSPRTARGLLRLIRTQVREAAAQNVDWRAVIDSLRPFTQKIWQSLPVKEQRRVLRHLRAYWDVHRHRIAPQIGAQMAGEMAAGQIELHAGRVTFYQEAENGIEVSYCDRATQESKKLRVDRVINCTGPDSDIRRVNSPLLSSLIHQRFVRPDQLSLGLDTAQSGSLVDAYGMASDFLYAIGLLRKGNLWESTAVPEIRAQVSELALELISRFSPQKVESAAQERVIA